MLLSELVKDLDQTFYDPTDNKIAKQITGLWGSLKKMNAHFSFRYDIFWATLFRDERREDEQPFEKCGLYKL